MLYIFYILRGKKLTFHIDDIGLSMKEQWLFGLDSYEMWNPYQPEG